MIKFGPKAIRALPKFFEYRNDVDIYTEDIVADKEFYRTLFKNIFGDSLKINDITPLGCKANVLREFDSLNNATKRRKYFIIDGDLDLIIGTNRKEEKGLIILDSYCIENYLIDEVGVVEFLYYSFGTEPREKIFDTLKFFEWLDTHCPSLIKLFINFAILKKYGGGPKIKHACQFLKQEGRQTILDSEKVDDYSETIRLMILEQLVVCSYKNPENLYDAEFKYLINKWGNDYSTLLKIVSGKDYLLPLLQFRICYHLNKGNSHSPIKSLKLFLANNSKLDRLNFLRDRIN